MSADPYGGIVRSLFFDPAHVAESAGEPATGESVYVDSQGVCVRFNAMLEDGVIAALSFRARGCPHVVASCEWICRQYVGRPASALKDLKPAAIMQTLAVPVVKTGRILVLEDAVRLLAERLEEPEGS